MQHNSLENHVVLLWQPWDEMKTKYIPHHITISIKHGCRAGMATMLGLDPIHHLKELLLLPLFLISFLAPAAVGTEFKQLRVAVDVVIEHPPASVTRRPLQFY